MFNIWLFTPVMGNCVCPSFDESSGYSEPTTDEEMAIVFQRENTFKAYAHHSYSAGNKCNSVERVKLIQVGTTLPKSDGDLSAEELPADEPALLSSLTVTSHLVLDTSEPYDQSSAAIFVIKEF